MTNTARGALLIALLASGPVGGAQVPPEVLLDQLRLRTERLIEADDLDAAVQVMEEAFALAAEHELELPPDFRLEHARVTLAVGLLGAAKESVTEHLAASGRDAESYLEAVELLENVDRILERRDAPECSPEPEGSACWRELTSHPGCYVWNPVPRSDETATWTGECSAGFAQGPGTVTRKYRDGEFEQEGNRRYGKLHGKSLIRGGTGWVNEGSNRFGKPHGRWVLRSVDDQVEEGPYVEGEKTGHWVETYANGNVGEGAYVNGKRSGRWIWRFRSGQVEEGPYVDGEQHGRWVIRPPVGDTFYVTFVRGVRQER